MYQLYVAATFSSKKQP